MLTRSLPRDYWKMIVEKRKFLDDLMREGMDPLLIFKAIRNRSYPPYECNEVFFETPLIEKIKRIDPEKGKEIFYAIRNLTALLHNPTISTEERERLLAIQERITEEYELDHPIRDYKELLDSFRSEKDINDVEDYADYPEESFSWPIDPHLRTEEQCEGKLFEMLFRYIEKYSIPINEKMLVGHDTDYTQRDIFELIAEILNLREPGRYDYEKIRTSVGNFIRIGA